MTRSYTANEILNLAIGRRWFLLIPAAVGLAAMPLLATLAPPRYRSDALILVVPQRVPENYVKQTVSQTVEERLPAITEQILSRSRLERIIVDMDLYKAERAHEVMEDVVQRMRREISTSTAAKEVDSFRVSYVSDRPDTARRVTERLASLYIEQNLRDRENQAVNTSQFLDTQLAEAKTHLIEQEKKLEAYRRAHDGQLPTQVPGNLQAIQNSNLQLQALNDSTNRALERRLLIERQIADTQAVPLPPTPSASSTDAAPLGTTSQQLEIARARLAFLLQRFTPNHPDVVAMQRMVADLATRLEQETVAGVGQTEAPPITPAEATQRKRILDLKAEKDVIDHQLASNRAEEERLKRTIGGYQSKVDMLPTRESELVELTRDYSTLQTAYANLLMKREESVIAANLERRQIGEQFTLLDAASMPQRPYNQAQRLATLFAGVGAGLMLGVLAIGFLEYRDSSFRYEDEVLKALPFPVLALIPAMRSERERTAAKRRRQIWDIAGSAFCFFACAVVVVWRFRS